jgi:NTP pyrophosphatase (non-canonical NTP hydrolase)
MRDVTLLIKQWATDRGLQTMEPSKQMLKLVEEVGELAAAIARNKTEEIVDSIGDIYVVLVILSMQLGLDVKESIEAAYEEIKDRKGKVINGVFIKENDLTDKMKKMFDKVEG